MLSLTELRKLRKLAKLRMLVNLHRGELWPVSHLFAWIPGFGGAYVVNSLNFINFINFINLPATGKCRPQAHLVLPVAVAVTRIADFPQPRSPKIGSYELG